MSASSMLVPHGLAMSGRVLVVDDDLGLQDTVSDILATTGLEAFAVGSATEATRWCEENDADLVLLDQRLPDASGLQLAALLKARAPRRPIILLTGYVSADSAIAAVGLVDDYLTKPVPPDELVKVVRVRLEQYRLQTANDELLEKLQEANARLENTVEERTRELRSARDQAMEASRLKSQFLANMSHEIRTPMNAVIGVTELLGRTTLTAEQATYLDILRTSNQALLDVINDVLDFSKIEAGHLELDVAPVVLRDVFTNVVTLFKPTAQSKGLELRIDYDEQLPKTVIADATRLRQVITNLMSNAVKFTATGGVHVIVESVAAGTDSVMIRCTVCDTGIGIDEHDVSRLFNEFIQLDGSNTRRFGGTGLGLAISRRLVRLMDGDIGWLPNPGGGSRFWFTAAMGVDIAHAAPARKSGNGSGSVARQPADDAPRLLVVEDNEINSVILTRMLTLLGYTSDVAGSGAEALEWVATNRYAAILMDCQMPVMDGFATTRELRRREAAASASHVPIIAITATATTEDEARSREAGMDDYLTKPIIVERLTKVLAQWAPIPNRSAST